MRLPSSRSIRALIVTNWPIKLTALILATVLWAVVSAEAPSEQLLPVTVIVELPEGRALQQPLPEVRALYAGAARDLIQLFTTPPVIRKRIPDTLSGSSYTIEFSTDDLFAIDNVDVQAQSVEPSRVNVQLDDLLRRSVRVVSRVVLEPDSGFAQLGPIILTPESVQVRGPDQSVRDVNSVSTVSTVRRGLSGPLRITVPIDTNGFGVMATAPRSVQVSADFVPEVERELTGVPVRVPGAAGQWESSPPVVVVTVRGPDAVVAGLTRDSIQVLASPTGTGEAETVHLTVNAPAGIESDVAPDTAVVRKRGGG